MGTKSGDFAQQGTIKDRYIGKYNWEDINRETSSIKKELVLV
jgi:hypothetical protein